MNLKTTSDKELEALAKRHRFNPYFLEYLKSPYDKEDVARLYKSSEPTSTLMEISMVWGMQRCAQMLEEAGIENAIKTFETLLDGELIELDNDEDLL